MNTWEEALRQRGAGLEHAGGTARVVRFGGFADAAAERRAAFEGIGLHALIDQSLIRVSGEDARGFLQGQLFNDIAQVSAQQAQWSGYCTPKGRVLASLLVWQEDADYMLQLPLELAESISRRLRMYVLRARVRIEQATPDQCVALGVAGKDLAKLLRAQFQSAPGNALDVTRAGDVTLVGLPGQRCLMITPAARTPELWDALAAWAVPTATQWWDWRGIGAGIASIGRATQDQFVPQMLNMDLIGALSFSKGCYPGQEIVARTRYLGSVKRRLFRFRSSIAGAAGDAVFAGSEACGTVINLATSPHEGYELLAVVPVEPPASAAFNLQPGGPALERLPLPYQIEETV